MAFLGIKSAGERVDEWFSTHPVLPGCNGSLTSKCQFDGTAADFQEYRRNWIQGCASDNSGGFLESKNKTLTKCQSVFDGNTTKVAFSIYEQNAAEKQYISDLLNADSPMTYVIVFLFVGLIVYLLSSN